MGLSLSKVA